MGSNVTEASKRWDLWIPVWDVCTEGGEPLLCGIYMCLLPQSNGVAGPMKFINAVVFC